MVPSPDRIPTRDPSKVDEQDCELGDEEDPAAHAFGVERSSGDEEAECVEREEQAVQKGKEPEMERPSWR